MRLSDVADVHDSVEDLRAAGLANGKPAVLVILFRQPGANIIETVDRVRALLPQLEASIPAAVKLAVAMDRTPTIRGSLREVEKSLVISALLVILVVFLFLRTLRATLIPSVAVPVSLIGTFGVMYLCGYSLDNLSLMALTIATGFVVDDAIVVLENISRHLEEGMPPREAAFLGAQGDRLHRPVDEHLAGRGLHPDPADGRNGRAALPRVRRDAFGGDRRLAAGLADDDADDVRRAPEIEHAGVEGSTRRASGCSTECAMATTGAFPGRSGTRAS